MKNACKRKRAFEIEYTNLSSIELRNIPPSVSKNIIQVAAKLFQDNESIIKVSVATHFIKNVKEKQMKLSLLH